MTYLIPLSCGDSRESEERDVLMAQGDDTIAHYGDARDMLARIGFDPEITCIDTDLERGVSAGGRVMSRPEIRDHSG